MSKREHIKRMFIIRLLTWLFGFVFLAVAVVIELVYLIPAVPIMDSSYVPKVVAIYRLAIVAFTILLYGVAWVVRGVYSDTKDTMLADMGDIELAVLQAKIEQVLEVRRKEKS